MTTNAELAKEVGQLREQVNGLAARLFTIQAGDAGQTKVDGLSEPVDGAVQVKTFTVTDPLTGEQLSGPAVVLSVDEQAGVAYVAPLSALGVAVPLDQLK